MKIRDLFDEKHPVISFEVFPPKTEDSAKSFQHTLGRLAELNPDYVSVTYGAGGTSSDNTKEIADLLKSYYGIEPLVHLTCINSSYAQVRRSILEFQAAGVENILALRGDKIPGGKLFGFFNYASDLISFIKNFGDFCIAGGCYPEGHPLAESLVDDIQFLKQKVDSGAEFLISQLFFNNEDFYQFQLECKVEGIDVPIEAGIMPITSKNQILKMATMCGASIPAKVSKMLCRYGDDPEALKYAGISYATDQCEDLIKHGVDGIHIYTMNNADVAEQILSGLKNRNIL